MTDLMFFLGAAGLAVLCAATTAILRRRRTVRDEARLDVARACGYRQAVADTERKHENEMRGATDEVQRLSGSLEVAVQAAKAAQARHGERVRALLKRQTELEAGLALWRRKFDALKADPTAKALADRLANAQAALEAHDVPGDLVDTVTADEWHELVAEAAAPLRLRQDPKLQELRAAGRFFEANRYAERLSVATEVKAADR